MALSPHEIRVQPFNTVKRGGYDQREVEAFRTAAAEALEKANHDVTAMEARARAAVARLQELQESGGGAPEEARDDSAAERSVAVEEAETISRTLLLAQRTADTTIAEAEREAHERLESAAAEAANIVEEAKAESRKAGEAERVRVEGEVQALLARRDFLESDVDHLEQFIEAQRERITEMAAQLGEVTSRIANGLAPMRRPQLSASDAEHWGDVTESAETAESVGEHEQQTGDDTDEADVAELIEQAKQTESGDQADSDDEPPPDGGDDQRHTLFAADEQQH